MGKKNGCFATEPSRFGRSRKLGPTGTGRGLGKEALGTETTSLPGRQALSSGADQTSDTAQLTALRHAAGAMIRAILIMSSLAGAMVSTPRLRAQDVGDAAALHARFVDYSDEPLRHKIDNSIKILEDALRVFGPDAVYACVEINQCVGCNSSPSHCSATTRPSWLRRAVGNRHRHAIEQVSHRWR